MKRKDVLLMAGLLTVLLGSGNVYAESNAMADVFPYKVEIKQQEVNEDYLFWTKAEMNIESEQCPELVEAVNAWAEEENAKNEADEIQYKERAEIDAKNLGDDFYGYSISEKMSIMRADERILSLKEEKSEYLDDAYPVDVVCGVSFDVQTGMILELDDIVKNPEEFQAAAVDFIVSYVKQTYIGQGIEVTAEQLNNYWDTELEWYLNSNGVNLIFNEDTLGPHALGIVEIPLTMANAQDYLKDEYAGFGISGVYHVRENIPLMIEDGEESFSLMLNMEEGEYDWVYSVMAGGETLELGQYGYLEDAYYLRRADGKHYLMFDADMASDDFTTYLLEVGKDGAKQKDTLFASIDAGCVSPDTFKMEFWLYTLGTYGAEKTYFIDENGLFGTSENQYTLKGNVESRFELKTTVDIPMYIDGAETVIPAGTGLRMVATDDESYALLQVSETGQIGELNFRRGEGDDSWNIYIGDMNAESCFEMLPYVG